MRQYFIIISLLLCALPLFSLHLKQGKDTSAYKPLLYSGEFSSDKDGQNFRLSDYVLFTDDMAQAFHISKGGRKLGAADIGYMDYSGPGFRAYMFGQAVDDYRAIAIEALADNGTAWYWIVLTDGKRIVNQQLIREPRANSDICDLSDFMQISISDTDCEIRMAIKHIAGYSYIPKNLRTDSQSVYITMLIGKKMIDSCQTTTDSINLCKVFNGTPGVQDSLLVDNDGTILFEGNPKIFCRYISTKNSTHPYWLILSKENSAHTMAGIIRIDKDWVHSTHCQLKDKKYVCGICVGNYPLMEKDSILFEIQEIYGITKDGEVHCLPLSTEIESCPEPFEPIFAGDETPKYYYFVSGGKKHFQSWQEL